HCRALDRIDDAAELGQEAVPDQFENPAVLFGDLGFEQLLAVYPQAVERVRLVLRHQPAVADHISGEDGGELAFHAARAPTGQEQLTATKIRQLRALAGAEGAAWYSVLSADELGIPTDCRSRPGGQGLIEPQTAQSIP